jgi:hypothetical protein
MGRSHVGFQCWVERSRCVSCGRCELRSHGGDAASAPWRCRTAARRRSIIDLGVAAQIDNGQGKGNKRGVLTDDVEAVDRGR